MAKKILPKHQIMGVVKPEPKSTPKPMSREEFRDAKKATRQTTKLGNISERGKGKGIEKAAKVIGAISSAIGAAAGIKNLMRKDSQTPSQNNQSTIPFQKKGGPVKKKK